MFFSHMLSNSEIGSWGAIFVAVGAVAAASFYFYRGRSVEESKITVELPKRDIWTIEQLQEFNGDDETKPIILGIEGKVYDVSKGKDYYGKDGGYHGLAGKDSTRLLAKNLLNEKKDNGEPLTDTEKDQLKQWKEFFEKKYPVVGSFVPKSKY